MQSLAYRPGKAIRGFAGCLAELRVSKGLGPKEAHG